jgi:sialate O-acetylesterase
MKTIILIVLLNLLTTQIYAQNHFVWPDSAEIAVCLTYDDAKVSHLDTVRPDLNLYNLKGTFFCPGGSGSVNDRMDEWREMVKEGHELGNHSLFHPCLKTGEDGEIRGEWLEPEFYLEDYTVRKLISELKIANTLLKAIDGKTKRSYSYTCSDFHAGGVDFSDKISHLFTGARSGGNKFPESIENLNLYFIPSFSGREPHSGQDLISFLEKAAEKRTLAVFIFHGVGRGSIKISRKAHTELLAYLAENRARFWVTTFSEMVEYIRANKGN